MSRRAVRVLHTSDVHLGPAASDPSGRQHDASCLCSIDVLESLVHEHNVDVLIVAGDLFDNARVPDDLVRDTFARLGALPAEVALFPGNHDVYDHTNVFQRNQDALDESGIAFFGSLGGGVHDFADGALRIWARAMDEHATTYQPLDGAPDHPGDRWYVIGAHGHFTDPGGDMFRSSRISADQINATQADYVALGHWHVTTDLRTRGATRQAWYSGAPLLGHGAGRVLLIDFPADVDDSVDVRPISTLV
jgi:DNA repair exonuclease SbcCD nuclease subunit